MPLLPLSLVQTYPSLGQAVVCMWRQEGGRAFYRGLLPTLLQIGPLSGFQFAFYHGFLHLWEMMLHPESHVTGKRSRRARSLLCSAGQAGRHAGLAEVVVSIKRA